MTPKEKAEELVDKYFKLLNYEFGDLVYSLRDKQPHKCASIAVDEIIGQWEIIDVYLADGNGELNQNLKYWYEVKQEIENL